MTVHNKKNQTPVFKKSIMALAMMGICATATGQEADTAETAEAEDSGIETIEVKGMRGSLFSAQNLKRNADTFVDSITSDDIGALPDRSVLEAMQRLPGVSIDRYAGKNDPDHFGVEGSGAVVRGMTQTRSEFNGRDSFTANSSRGLSFQDVSPELMGGVDIFKNQTADMIEGGIAGTVSLRTRKPFDSDGEKISVSLDYTRGDMVKDATPTFSALYSNNWKTDSGKFGILLNFSDSQLKASNHQIRSSTFAFRALEGFSTGNHDYPGFGYASNPYVYDGSLAYPPGGTEVGDQGVLTPKGAAITMKTDDRTRKGYAAGFQWESPDETLKATAQFMRSDSALSWKEYATGISPNGVDNSNRVWPSPGEEYEFDSNGVFTSGYLTDIADGWRGDGNHVPHNVAAGWGGAPVANFGQDMKSESRLSESFSVVDDYTFNLTWTPSDSLKLELDLQHIKAETGRDDMTLGLTTWANQYLDISGDHAKLDLISPWQFTSQEVKDAYAADGSDFATDDYFAQPQNYLFNHAMDHYDRSVGESDAARFDATYYTEYDFITQVKVGVRYAKRDQNIKNSTYNWGPLAPIYDEAGWLTSPQVAEAGLAEAFQLVDWSKLYRGGAATVQGGDYMIHPSDELLHDYANWGTRFAGFDDRCGDWQPMAMRRDTSSCELLDLDGYFRPNEVSTVSETNTAAYVRLDFEYDGFEDHRVAGNFGVRVVRMETNTTGFTRYPDLRPSDPFPEGFDPNNWNPADYDLFSDETDFLSDVGNYLPADVLAFANDASSPNFAENSYTKVLPSFNLKVDINDDMLARFAVSKAMALPDLGNMRNYADISTVSDSIERDFLAPIFPQDYIPLDAEGNPRLDANGDPLSENRQVDVDSIRLYGWKANSGNPLLKPMESVQYDASLEWYFADVGSMVFSVFYKDLSNFFINGAYDREFTNPTTGVTNTVSVAGPLNGGDGSMKGIEISYQQFFDMLPAPFDGFGIQANYSYIKARGVPNSDIDAGDVDNRGQDNQFQFTDNLPLERQSDHTANLIAMYEKDDWSARIAYNWRSEFLVTTRDVISYLPIFNEAAGYMDASVSYNINENVKIVLQGVNLLNTQVVTFMKADSSNQLPRSWNVSDRRYSLAIRANF
ncbi:TonB-dependent receptor [Paraglaciecola sp.]|uniref:TonB-dependent receptor n=1 Tax=Paraglaciecola sp. TaxID=1920173 RepID=UPI003EF8AD47